MRSALSARGPGHDVNLVVGAQGCSDIGLGGQALAWAERSGVGVGDVVLRRLSGGACVWAGGTWGRRKIWRLGCRAGYTKWYGGFADEEGLMEIWYGNRDVSIS
jgi:hypothetical protein